MRQIQDVQELQAITGGMLDQWADERKVWSLCKSEGMRMTLMFTMGSTDYFACVDTSSQ